MVELAHQHGLDYRRSFDGYVADWSSLQYSDGRPIEFQTVLPAAFPEVGILLAPGGRVLDQQGWAVVNGDHLVLDANFIHEDSRFQYFRRIIRLNPVVDLPGTTLNLGAVFSGGNYGHALLDGLGRLSMLSNAAIDPTTIDNVLLPPFRSGTIDALLDEVGIDPQKRIRLSHRSNYRAELLLQPSFPGAPRVYPKWLAPFFRSLQPAPSTSSRRLLILRFNGRRSVTNASELVRVADSFGFEVYDPMTSSMPPRDFAEAGIVVAAHGAAMTDLVFCAPGTQVVELMPSGHRYPYFATLAASSGLGYTAIDSPSVSLEAHASFSTDPEELQRVLESFD